MKGLRGLNYEERLKALKLHSLEKKKDEKRFSYDSQGPLQPNPPGRNSTVQVLQKARTKEVITLNSSTNRENPKKKEQFCMQSC